MEVKAEVQMQNEVVFLFGRSLAFHCSYYDSFFLVNAPRSFGMPDPCKNCRVQHSCRVLLTCKKEFLSIKTSCSVWSQGGVENGERIRFSQPYNSALEPLSSSSSSSSPSLITSFLIEPNVNRLSLDLAFGRRRTDFFWYIYLSVCISSQADEASHHTVRIRYLATVCLTWWAIRFDRIYSLLSILANATIKTKHDHQFIVTENQLFLSEIKPFQH